jgi:uncharacterized iron-regulated protein
MLQIMAVAILSASLVACAGTQANEQSQDVPSGKTFSPLLDLYDRVWIKGEDGAVKTLAQVADDLSRYDVVFFGEFHGHSGIHLAQMQLFRALQQRNAATTLSLEQFERDTQPLVDQYLAGEIGEKTLQKDGRGWDNYEQSYRPLVEFSRDNHLPVLAANAPKQIVICVSKKGLEILDEMPQPDRSWVAEDLHVEEGAYMDKYTGFVSGSSTHGGKESDADADKDADKEADEKMSKAMQAMVLRSFSAQVTRDDTMAESIANHLQDNPGRKVFHLDGHFHSASHLGTVERLKMRMPDLEIAVINPIAAEDNNKPFLSDEDAATGDYIILVRQLPEMFVSEERELEYERKVIRKRMSNKCVYAQE